MDLLDRIAAQDEPALRSLYEATSSRLYGLALRILRHKDWAEDVLQDSYLHIWRSASGYRGSLSPPLAWMGLVVRSRALDFLRRRRAERLHLNEEFDEAQLAAHGGGSNWPRPASRRWRCTSAWSGWKAASARWSAWPTCVTSATANWPASCSCRWARSKPGSGAAWSSCAAASRAMRDADDML